MKDNFVQKIFVNPAIELGIQSYIMNKNGQRINRLHTFEFYVIKALTVIYGEKSILLPYNIDNETAFTCNLLMYDLKDSDALRFIDLMNEYYNFIENYKSEQKANGLISEIENILLQMIKLRSHYKEFTQDDLKIFDEIFNPINGDLKQIKRLVSTDQGLIQKYWQDGKKELSNTQINLIAINPNLLSKELYAKYGYSIVTIASLDKNEINNINTIIEEEEKKEYLNIERKNNSRKKIILTSGSGFVDKLLVLSIISTFILIVTIIINK